MREVGYEMRRLETGPGGEPGHGGRVAGFAVWMFRELCEDRIRCVVCEVETLDDDRSALCN